MRKVIYEGKNEEMARVGFFYELMRQVPEAEGVHVGVAVERGPRMRAYHMRGVTLTYRYTTDDGNYHTAELCLYGAPEAVSEVEEIVRREARRMGCSMGAQASVGDTVGADRIVPWREIR